MPPKKYQLTEGPLPKSVFTFLLEEITRKLMSEETLKIIETDVRGVVKKIRVAQTDYNLEEIIKHANLEHICLNHLDFDLYNQFHAKNSGSLFQSKLIQNNEGVINPQIPEVDQKKSFPEFSFAEMCSINIYTLDTCYSLMNSLLRGIFTCSNDPPNETDESSLRETLIHSVMCASALNKVPNGTKDVRTFRGEKKFDENVIRQRVAAAENESVVYLPGFISTTTRTELPLLFGREIRYHFIQGKGKNISGLSAIPQEKEFLSPPTQIQILKHERTPLPSNPSEYLEIITAKAVNDLASLDSYHLHSPNAAEYQNFLLQKLAYMHHHTTEIWVKNYLSSIISTIRVKEQAKITVLPSRQEIPQPSTELTTRIREFNSMKARLNGTRPIGNKSLSEESGNITPLALT